MWWLNFTLCRPLPWTIDSVVSGRGGLVGFLTLSHHQPTIFDRLLVAGTRIGRQWMKARTMPTPFICTSLRKGEGGACAGIVFTVEGFKWPDASMIFHRPRNQELDSTWKGGVCRAENHYACFQHMIDPFLFRDAMSPHLGEMFKDSICIPAWWGRTHMNQGGVAGLPHQNNVLWSPGRYTPMILSAPLSSRVLPTLDHRQ